MCTWKKVAERYRYSFTQRIYYQKSEYSLDTCAQEGSIRVLHVVLTVTFYASLITIKASLYVVVFFLFYFLRNKSSPLYQWVCLLDFFCVLRQLLSYTVLFFNVILKCQRILLRQLEKDCISREWANNLIISLWRWKYPY